MVAPLGVAAAQAGSAGATVLGLSLGKTDLDLTRDLFKLQMRQAKRLWTADFAEASARHGEACQQSAQQHAEAQALATAAYWQAERLAALGMQLARDQDSRTYEMSWRAEVRESLRDELANQNNRFNIIMLCDTVCLSCVFSLLADGRPPDGISPLLLNAYVLMLGLSTTIFTISLWCAVLVVRRLHEHTASTLERKLFAQSPDLQRVWQEQLDKNLPTGPLEMHLVNQAYEQWMENYINPIGKTSLHLLSVGVVAMFVAAGILNHATYLLQYNVASAVYIFWATVLVTSITVNYLKISEDRMEKRKEFVYDASWQDHYNDNNNDNNNNSRNALERTGPFAKIMRAADALFSPHATGLCSAQRLESLRSRELHERDYCAKSRSLHKRVQTLRRQTDARRQTRQDILQLLTTAAEELDALPEDLQARLHKLLHDIDEADNATANMLSMEAEQSGILDVEGSMRNVGRLARRKPRAAMAAEPIDAQRTTVFLPALRKELGKISLTTLLRIRNLSDEPLRLKSGLQLKSGRYVQSLQASDVHGETLSHYLYPVSEIPPRSEVVICARSGGGWVPTSGIEGVLVYTNKDESWAFRVSFCNELMKGRRQCQVLATQNNRTGSERDSLFLGEQQYWQVSREELDRKANFEAVVSIDVVTGDQAITSARLSQTTIKSGFLLKNRQFGLRLQWSGKWFVLTPSTLVYSNEVASNDKTEIAIKDITAVRPGTDMVQKHVFEILVRGRESHRLAASSLTERNDWIQKISDVSGLLSDADDIEASAVTCSEESSTEESVSPHDAIECVRNSSRTEVMHS